MTDYTPIPCHDYDLFEIACLRRQALLVRWAAGSPPARAAGDRGEAAGAEQRIAPVGLAIRDGAEWVEIRVGAEATGWLRLDWIAAARLAP
jgi:transcriptional antiterminator Rof (Rho-off)